MLLGLAAIYNVTSKARRWVELGSWWLMVSGWLYSVVLVACFRLLDCVAFIPPGGGEAGGVVSYVRAHRDMQRMKHSGGREKRKVSLKNK